MKKHSNATMRSLATLLGAMAIIAMTQNHATAGAPVARWNLGEQDAGAVAGNPGNATTTSTVNSPVNDLTQVGSPSYNAAVPAGGSTLSMSFSGGQYYIGSQTGGVVTNLVGMDVNNFSVSYDCYPTGNSGYSTPFSIGTYGGGSQFAFINGANWCLNYNGAAGSGQPVIAPVQMNAWQNITWVRRFGTNVYYFNGVPMLTNTFFGGGTFSGAICIGGIIKNTAPGFDAPGGDFQGYVDNVVITNLNLATPPVISAFAASPGKIYAGNSIILNATLSGDPAGRTVIIRTNGVQLAASSSLPYKINGVTTNNNANYDIIVTNNYGAATSSIVAVSVLASGGADVMKFRMGDNDPGAVAGNTGNAQTIDAILGNNLDIAGNPTYTNVVPAGGGALSMSFDGASYYRSTNLAAFLSGLDQANYSISFDAYCTALGGGGFSFPMSFGKNGGGLCVVEIGGTWYMYRLGIDTQPIAPVQLNTWTHFEIQRRNFDTAARIRVFMNGVDMGYQGTSYNAPSGILTAGGNTIGDGVGTEGLFNGFVDNIVIHNYSIGALPSINSFTASPGTSIATNEALTLTTVMSGGTPATYRYQLNGTTVATEVTNNNSSVTLPAPVAAGNYRVIVSNSPAGVVTSSIVAITVDARSANPSMATYNLGEQDPGAANGAVANALTLQFDGIKDLSRIGSPHYTNFVPSGGSTLACAFDGTTDKFIGTGSAWSAFYSNPSFNPNNFQLEFDVYQTGTGRDGFVIPVALGRNAAYGGTFAWNSGGVWNINWSGIGNEGGTISTALNTWQHLKLVRKDYGSGNETRLYVNGVDSGIRCAFASGSFAPQAFFTIGGNKKGADHDSDPDTYEGPFPGVIDNVVLRSPVPPAIPTLSVSLSGGQALVNLIGGEPSTTYRLERTTSFTPTSWSTVDTQVTDGAGAVLLTDPTPPAGPAFYRAVTP